jgi:hypothetical protein
MAGQETMDQIEGDEDLFALEDHPDAKAGEVRKTFLFLRHVAQEETEQNQAAERLLRRMTLQSGLADLRHAEEILHEEIQRLETEEARPSQAHRRGARLQREFKAWLSAIRAFDDRTSAWLSDQFGKDGQAYVTFKRLLSHEFDTNFGYRLCCALRNVSEHESDVINDVHIHVSRNPDSGAREISVTIRFDGPRLAENFPRIRAATREELRSCEKPVELALIVKAVSLSCQQVHAGLFLAMWPEIQSAIEIIEQAHQEAVDADGDWATFVQRSAYAEMGRRPSTMSMRHNAYELAELARRNHAQTSAVQQQPFPTLTAQDFME